MRRLDTQAAVTAIKAGEVIAYPTEAVYGLGCDPMNEQAVMQLLAIKQRPVDKGLIVIGAEYEQLRPLMAEISSDAKSRANRSWPGAVTWLFPAHPSTPQWLTGRHNTIALRVPDHSICQTLCQAFGPIVSTSANRAEHPPPCKPEDIDPALVRQIAGVVEGEVGGHEQPSEIRSLIDNEVIRHG